MAWIDLLDRAEFLRKLYPSAPSLREVRVFEVGLRNDGPVVNIRFNLNEFPAAPPTKWIQACANTVQVRLMCVGVLGLEVQGWPSNLIADIDIERSEKTGLILTASAEGFRFKGVFEFISVDAVSAYLKA
ncbi:Imm50 family immunity protein [Cystobacter fuscus]|uniref:Imm50 family immunity protein n=1 Tax=Cystobacter fuscus TaxID=43 RepID=UPI0037BEC072